MLAFIPLPVATLMENLTSLPGIAGMVLLALVSTALAYASRYKRCPSNKIGASLVFPLVLEPPLIPWWLC